MYTYAIVALQLQLDTALQEKACLLCLVYLVNIAGYRNVNTAE